MDTTNIININSVLKKPHENHVGNDSDNFTILGVKRYSGELYDYINICFNKAINEKTIDLSSVKITDQRGNKLEGEFSYDVEVIKENIFEKPKVLYSINYYPKRKLYTGEVVFLTMLSSESGLKSLNEDLLDKDYNLTIVWIDNSNNQKIASIH